MRYVILILAIVLLFSSCSDNSNSNLEIFRTSDAGFRTSTETISSSNMQIYHALESRLHDPQYSKVEIWEHIAMQVHLISDSITQYITRLKADLKKEAGQYKKGEAERYDEKNFKAVNRLFDIKGEELFHRMINYRKNILSLDTLLNNQFEHIVRLFSPSFDYKTQSSVEFVKTFFNKIPAVGAMAVLSKFENDVRVNENMFITFCINKTYRSFCGYNRYVPLIMQSSNYLKAGNNLEITAGIGSFSVECRPQIIINGKNIQVDTDGVAIYNFKTPLKAGKYVMPIKMEYTKPDGTKSYFTKNIEYTVINPNQNSQ